ncbi:MAG: GatB/YqeY domain-containing protein [Chloroflexi bacterium]|nr:GatB/YqeY domain-containing protein [Chloroflexota bacterium]
MRARDRLRLDTIRSIKALAINEEIKRGATLTDQQVEEIVARLVRQHRESIEVFSKNQREDLAAKEKLELDILLSYLPEQLSADAIRALAEEAATAVGAAGPGDKGKIMGRLMPQVKGKADGKLVNEVVMALLERLAA